MLAGLSDIARCTAWTGNLVNNSASDHFLHWWFERWHSGFEFSEGHDDGAWSTTMMEGGCLFLSTFPSVLYDEGKFSYRVGSLCRWVFIILF